MFLSGVQALVRVLLDQHRADDRAGLTTASLISGYQGSPLAGFDREVARLGPLASEHHLVARPAVNEELGATSAKEVGMLLAYAPDEWDLPLEGTVARATVRQAKPKSHKQAS